MHSEINWNLVFQSIPSITGLPLRFERGKWYGYCYINGEKHSRWDKTVVYLVKEGIRILEQGGENISILNWLIKYGGCSDYASAYSHLRSNNSYVLPSYQTRTWVEPKLKYVPESEVGLRFGECNLFTFLAEKFGSDRVQKIWDRYKVGSKVLKNGNIATVFWYLNSSGQCCHDKVMLYDDSGHRSHEYGGTRRFKVGEGYRGKCYFGSHLLNLRWNNIFLLESEKSCLIASIVDPCNLYIATGGANMLRDVSLDYKILPDADNPGQIWVDRYPTQCIKWWEFYNEVENGNDIADMILRGEIKKW